MKKLWIFAVTFTVMVVSMNSFAGKTEKETIETKGAREVREIQ